MSIYLNICNSAKENRKQLAILIDPDKTSPVNAENIARESDKLGVDYFFAGSSLLINGDLETCIKALRSNAEVPVVIFPGNNLQISSQADAILLLSLISGRNPEMLIGNHVIAAPQIKSSGLEVIPTGYILIDCGRIASVHYMSNTLPIPPDKHDIAICTAMAGEMLGLKTIYLDGGSGADKPVPAEMIRLVKEHIKVPLIAGGGVCNANQASEIWNAGVDLLVVGNALEKDAGLIEQLVNMRNELNSPGDGFTP